MMMHMQVGVLIHIHILILMYDALFSVFQSISAAKAVSWQELYWVVCHCLPSSGEVRNLEFGLGADDS